jgi:hypothetical protein
MTDFDYLTHKHDGIGGPGSLPNDKVRNCTICAGNGYPHEPITFKKEVVEKWIPFDYFEPWKEHRHKRKPCIE